MGTSVAKAKYLACYSSCKILLPNVQNGNIQFAFRERFRNVSRTNKRLASLVPKLSKVEYHCN